MQGYHTLKLVSIFVYSPDGKPLSKRALKKMEKKAEKDAKKAEYKSQVRSVICVVMINYWNKASILLVTLCYVILHSNA